MRRVFTRSHQDLLDRCHRSGRPTPFQTTRPGDSSAFLPQRAGSVTSAPTAGSLRSSSCALASEMPRNRQCPSTLAKPDSSHQECFSAFNSLGLGGPSTSNNIISSAHKMFKMEKFLAYTRCVLFFFLLLASACGLAVIS